MSRKVKRFASKKRKIEAYLDIANLNDQDGRENRKYSPVCEEGISIKSTTMKNKETDEECSNAAKISIQETTAGQGLKRKLNDTFSEGQKLEYTAEELKELRMKLRARQKLTMEKPKIYLTRQNPEMPGLMPPLFLRDLQNLLSYALLGLNASFKPTWCKLLRVGKVAGVLLVILEDVSVKELESCTDCFPFITSQFEMRVNMVSPTQYDQTAAFEMFSVPKAKKKMKYDTFKMKQETKKRMIRNVSDSLGEKSDQPCDGINDNCRTKDQEVPQTKPTNYKMSKLELLLNPEQMKHERFPIPVFAEQYVDYVFSKESYSEVTDNSPMFALDCEMCLTTLGRNELTKVAVVNENLEVVYESLVLPYNRIVNYLTRYSGITKKILTGVTTRLEDVQEDLRKVLPSSAILCGQSLSSDLHALHMFHPYVIDTSVIYNLAGIRGIKPGLKRLTSTFLRRDIQSGVDGHSPAEDATATMELVQLKLEQGNEFGDVVIGGPLSFDILEGLFADQAKKQRRQESFGTNDINSSKALTMHQTCINNSKAVTMHQAFFNRNDYSCFFDLAKKNEKSAVRVTSTANGTAKNARKSVHKMATDKEVVKQSRQLLQDHFFVASELCVFAKQCQPDAEEEKKKKVLLKMDKRVRKLMKSVSKNFLVAVVLPGRTTRDTHALSERTTSDNYLDAVTLIHIS